MSSGFADSVRRVGEGGSALDPEVVLQMLGRRRVDDRLAGLTERDREVLALMAEGRSNQAIARRLVVTERAVETARDQHFRQARPHAGTLTITAACWRC